MTIRSMPPASSHLALMPAPAPPPMRAWPAAILSRKRWRIEERYSGIVSGPQLADGTRSVFLREVRLHQRVGEGWVVDVQGEPADLAERRGLNGGFQLVEEGGIRL